MSIKYVKYNGGTETWHPCSSPECLCSEKVYEVIRVEVDGYKINYHLKNVEGFFNSCWFDAIPIYIGIATNTPKLNETFTCEKIVPLENAYCYLTCIEDVAKQIEQLNENTFKVFSSNSCYFIQLCP